MSSKPNHNKHDPAPDGLPPLPSDSSGQGPGPTRSYDLQQVAESPSRRIGPYKLLQLIGQGGMGSVWMAEQEEPVRRRVALKLVREGFSSKEVLARFEAERQALAMMDHQNIAKVLDAGVTEDGQPFFAMELVQGIPFTEYCDKNKLTPDERLGLFIPVCRAIQHAHQKGIIHRDIKPSNVLVTLYDGQPVPKVIDFGLAKALQHQTKLTDKTMFTEFGKVIGTLNYMSPEQAEMNALDVDTRTDIYSLGVMLYELLTGSTPLEKETAQQQALFNVLQSIREDEPPRPSQRLSSSGDKIEGISKQRKIEPRQLQKILKGDLDWIVMKALEKDRTRRYETANDFAQDVERYIAGAAVEARPPTTAYRLSKFVHKNRGLVATGTTIVSLLLLSLTAISIFSLQVRTERDKARFAESTARMAESAASDKEREARQAEAAMAVAQQRTKQALAESKATLARSNYLLAKARWNENRVSEACDLLEKIPEEHRKFEWYRDRRRFLGSDVTCFGHQSSVSCVAFSPDGNRVVSSSYDNTLMLWDAKSGGRLNILSGHTSYVSGVAFSPDGKKIVSSSHDNTLKLWDALSGQELKTLSGHVDWVDSVAFSPDGKKIVSGSWDETLRLWDVKKGLELGKLMGHDGPVISVAFSPDGSRIVSGSVDATLKVWDVRNWSCGLVSGSCGLAAGLAAGADFKTYLAGTFLAREAELHSLSEHTNAVRSVAFSPEGSHIVSGGDDNLVKVWDARSGVALQSLSGHGDGVVSVAFSPGGSRIVSGSDDNTLKVWDTHSGEELQTLSGHTGPLTSVAFRPDGSRIVSGSHDNSLKLWDARSGLETQTLSGHLQGVTSVAFSPDGKWIVSGSLDKTLKKWDATSGLELQTLLGHTGAAVSVAVSPGGDQIVSVGEDSTLKVWDARSGAELRTISEYRRAGATAVVGRIADVAFNPDGSRIMGSIHDKMMLWDTRMLSDPRGGFLLKGIRPASPSAVSLQLTLSGHAGNVSSFAMSPDGSRIVSGGEDKMLKLWDASSGSELQTLSGHTDQITSIVFSPDGSRIASGCSDGTLKLWDARSGMELQTLSRHTGAISSLAISPDGSRLVSGSDDGTLNLWDARGGFELRTLSGHTDEVLSVAVSPDGSWIASGSDDKTLILWEVRTGLELETLSGHTGAVSSVAFSSDGALVYSRSAVENEVLVWDVNQGKRLSDEPWQDLEPNVEAPDGRWLVVPSGNKVVLVDCEFKNDPDEKAYREGKSRLDPLWQSQQAVAAEMQADFYAATFHGAWAMKADPQNAKARSLLFYRALGRLIETHHDESVARDAYLAPVVIEALEGGLSKTAADQINCSIWNKVAVPSAMASQSDVRLMRLVCEKFSSWTYWKTLAVTEYRMGNSPEAIKAAETSIESAHAEEATSHPIDLAMLCMSHFEIGKTKEANDFRRQLDEAMKLDRWKNDTECKAFLAEVNALFDATVVSEAKLGNE